MSEDWIKHNDTICPVPKGTLVDIRCRNGDRFDRAAAGIKIEVLPFFWWGTGSACDIVEYRICEEKQNIYQESFHIAAMILGFCHSSP